jgi:hypothetical protein
MAGAVHDEGVEEEGLRRWCAIAAVAAAVGAVCVGCHFAVVECVVMQTSNIHLCDVDEYMRVLELMMDWRKVAVVCLPCTSAEDSHAMELRDGVNIVGIHNSGRFAFARSSIHNYIFMRMR